jgi:hypothetical protein
MRCKTCNKIFPKDYFISSTMLANETAKFMECLYCAEVRSSLYCDPATRPDIYNIKFEGEL